MGRFGILLGGFALVALCGGLAFGRERRPVQPPEKSESAIVMKYKNKVAVVDTSKGRIIVKFFLKDAPKSVYNFASLADQEFYDGLIFHRVIKGFVIQGGCPYGNGAGGPGWQINAEFNPNKHLAGSVAMALSPNDPNSAGSQFYICLEPQPFLDGKYTVFGQVTKGMDVVKAIGEVKTDAKDRPTEEVKIFKIRIMDEDKADKLGDKGE